jgi:hypothetical protein
MKVVIFSSRIFNFILRLYTLVEISPIRLNMSFRPSRMIAFKMADFPAKNQNGRFSRQNSNFIAECHTNGQDKLLAMHNGRFH